MFETIDTLRHLYDKIIKGTATEDEKRHYELCIKTSCIDTETLLNIIKNNGTSKRS